MPVTEPDDGVLNGGGSAPSGVGLFRRIRLNVRALGYIAKRLVVLRALSPAMPFAYVWNRLVRRVRIDSPSIFIVGCGHSGTSLMLALLGAHSRIYAVPYESNVALHDGADPDAISIARRAFDFYTIAQGKHRWVEKTPRHIHHIDRLLSWYPDARILLIIRDGRDVACSIRDRTGSLEEGAQRWVTDNLVGEKYWRHPSVHVFKYEDVIGDFESTMKKITEFLGEAYESGMESYHQTPFYFQNSKKIEKPATASGADHERYRSWQINQPMFDGRGRWKQLSDEDMSRVEDVAGEMLRKLGYADSESDRPSS